MILSYEEKNQSIYEVNRFKSSLNLQIGKGFLTKVMFEKSDGYTISDTCNCYIHFDHGYQQYTIQIDWSYSDRILEKNSMHRGYNTNFQKFEYIADSNELLIFDNNIKITIAEGD